MLCLNTKRSLAYKISSTCEGNMSVSYWNDSTNGKTMTVDITVIGGGIAGLSTAYWLHKEDPSLKIALVEKYEMGSGASGRNAGFVTCGSVEHFNRLVGKHGKDEANEIWKFSEENLRLLKEEIIQGKNSEFGFEEKGSFSLASTDNEFSELKDSAQIMKNFGIKVEVVEGSDIKKRLGADNFVGGIKYCGDGSVHPISLLKGIRQKLEGKIQFFENNEVYKIETINGNKIVRTNKVILESSMVVAATNGYSPLIHSFFEDKIFPTRGQILATEAVPLFMEGPCYANFVLDYFRQLPTGQMIIGGFRQLQKDVEKGYSDETTEVIQKALEEFLIHHIPNVRKAKITHRWSGIMGFSVDGQPLVGALPNDPQFFFCGGFTGHGMGLAFNSAKTLVDSIFGRPIPKFISAKRFH
jgi:gamma-glutamylputrescine oxidase